MVAETPRGRPHWAPLLVTALAVVVVDQVAKAAVRASLVEGETRRIAPFLRLHRTQNDGLLGGHLSGAAVPVGIVTAIGIAVGLVLYARRPGMPRRLQIAFGLLLGGGIGNMIDRLRLGHVTDFIARGPRDAFNLSDLAIYAGLALIVLSLWARREQPQPAEVEATDGG